MKRARRRIGAGGIVRELRAQGDRIVSAIQKASDDATRSREALAGSMLERGAGFLRAALDEGTPRTMVVHRGGKGQPRTVTLEPPAANDAADEPAPTTTPGGPANDDDEPPPDPGSRRAIPPPRPSR